MYFDGTRTGDYGAYAGSKETIKCKDSYRLIVDEMNNSDYFKKNKNLPSVGARVILSDVLKEGRVQVLDTESRLSVGFVETDQQVEIYECLQDGYIYKGNIKAIKEKEYRCTIEVDKDES